MSRRFLVVALMLTVVVLAPSLTQARMVHQFRCLLCHQMVYNNGSYYFPTCSCLSCHYAGNASTYELTTGEPSNPVSGTFASGDASNAMGSYPEGATTGSQTSHYWDGSSQTAPAAGALPPLDPYFFLRSTVDELSCPKCHNPHEVQSNEHLLRLGAGSADTMCLDCHRSWNQTGNHGLESHPMHGDYASLAAANPDKFRPAPDNFGTNGNITLVGGNRVSCTSCHGVHFVDSDASTVDGPDAILSPGDGKLLKFDGPEREDPDRSLCQSCHSYDQHGLASGLGCMFCHGGHEYDPAGLPNYFMLKKELTLVLPKTGANGTINVSYRNFPSSGTFEGICLQCHSLPASHEAGWQCRDCHSHKAGFFHGAGSSGEGCVECHGHDSGTLYDPDMTAPYTAGAAASQGRGTVQSHSTHTELDGDDAIGPGIYCDGCHDIGNVPYFKSGTDANGDGKYDLAETDVCDTCHSSGGAFNGISSTGDSVGAKDNWRNGVYAGAGNLQVGKEKWCIGCHDGAPSVIGGESAPDKAGDNSSYGYYVSGHGAQAAYPKLSWQDSSAAGNPGANRACSDCHDTTALHIVAGGNPASRRLKAGYENDQNNSNCNNCHETGGMADNGPLWYTSSAAYETSAHSGTLCSDCHDVHGTSNPAMTKGNQEQLCYQCHTDGMVQNNAISGAGLADDIQQAFAASEIHDLGTDYGIGGSTYKLECVSCHNVHLITGKYWQADQDKSPITRISVPSDTERNLELWGDEPGEKMLDYGGTYRTPNGETYAGHQLPDYATFCLECHAQPAGGHSNFGINWAGDAHGLRAANSPAGGGTCPDWYGCGKANGWDGDDCIGDEEDCWPVMTRGKGDQLFSRGPYNHDERIAGANFALSCTDCHEAHGSNNSSMVRTNPNAGTGTVIWNTMCNNCHYYYSDWHAGMSCGTASCHVSNSIHRMGAAGSAGGTRIFDPELVLHYSFNGNLNDSGSWRMHGKWMDNLAGTFGAGKNGQALVLDGGKNVQVGTRNDYWSTDEGRHGTWKYTEMKYNTTLEAWVYPTEDTASDYSIFTKHTGTANGGYAFNLRKVNGSLRASFSAQIDNNGFAQDGRAGLRGAYSDVSIPLNQWSHVAVSFDRNGPDRDSGDPSVGRIRIYVNGEDVTTSDSSGNYMQPGTGETSIYSYSENSPWNQEICYNGTWCASEFSVGGFYGWQNEFIGRLDDAKVWNITKDASYFAARDAETGPFISSVTGTIGSNQLTVNFSEGVYAATGASGALQASDFSLVDSDNSRSITGVSHTAGSATATLTLSAPLDDTDDFNVDSLAAVAGEIYDEHDNSAGVASVIIVMSAACPSGEVRFDLNEAPGSSYAFDVQSLLPGQVIGVGTLTGSSYFGDGVSNYIDFENNNACLQASTEMTLEARIKPTGLEGTANYIRRLLARDSGGNYQLSVWRNNGWTNYNAPDGTASIALWVKPQDAHGGNAWKPVLSDYDTCPIVSDHWYQVKAVWNSGKAGGTPGQFFVPADIYIDDQGTDGLGGGENWSGYANCTNSAQSYNADAQKLYSGDQITAVDGDFTIGANVNNHANNVFNGQIDWIRWKDVAD